MMIGGEGQAVAIGTPRLDDAVGRSADRGPEARQETHCLQAQTAQRATVANRAHRQSLTALQITGIHPTAAPQDEAQAEAAAAPGAVAERSLRYRQQPTQAPRKHPPKPRRNRRRQRSSQSWHTKKDRAARQMGATALASGWASSVSRARSVTDRQHPGDGSAAPPSSPAHQRRQWAVITPFSPKSTASSRSPTMARRTAASTYRH